MADDLKLIVRKFLKELSPSASHRASEEPAIEDIYTPPGHAEALDPDRALVVGNRGVGKSFWASVLQSDKGRKAIAEYYPKLGLHRIDTALGFHEGAGSSEGIAPSRETLKAVLTQVDEPLSIWRTVLFLALQGNFNFEDKEKTLPLKFADQVILIQRQPELFEDTVIRSDKMLKDQGQRFLLIFDALDRMAADWESIRRLTTGIAKLALDLRATKAIRIKIFMRQDQFDDAGTMRFPDSSKLKSAKVALNWKRVDLYGLLFNILLRSPSPGEATSELFGLRYPIIDSISKMFRQDEEHQQRLFANLAGQYMGTNHRRGVTYSWLHTHLADAFGETSPRSFLIALRAAARKTRGDAGTPIDHHGLREAVQEASRVRVDELNEDYPWVERALKALSGEHVPCPEDTFINSWKENKTIDEIKSMQDSTRPTTPIELDLATGQPEAALIDALETLGVIERRKTIGKINVPDIFRVAAELKRRGGVPPRRQK